MQTAYNLRPAVGLPGQVADIENSLIVSYPASEVIPFGIAVEVVSGQVRALQDTGATLGKFVGVSVYQDAREQALGGGSGSYQIGDMVPVLRSGRVYAQWNGTTQGEFVVPNLWHPSDNSLSNASKRGVFTDAATAITVGAEITACPASVIEVRDTGSTSLCLLEINLPGA